MLLALVEPKRASSQVEMSCFWKRPGPLAGLPWQGSCWDPGSFPKCLCSTKKPRVYDGGPAESWELADLDPWLGSWPWLDQKKSLFSSRNELFLEETWTPGWAPGPIWTQKVPFSSRNELLFEETWTPVWAPGAVLFSSRNELFLEKTWTPGWAPGLFGPKRACSQAEMSCF